MVNRQKKKLCKWAGKNLLWYKLRLFLYRQAGYSIGDKVYIAEGFTIAEKLEDQNNLIIHDRVAIGPNVTVVTSSNPNFSNIRPFITEIRGKIIINSDAWIGAGAIILPNVTIGEGAVVGAGAVVTKDVNPYTIVAGVPANKIGDVKVSSAIEK